MRAYLLRYGTKIYWRLRLARGRVPVATPVAITRNVPYLGRLRRAHMLDVYRPQHATGALPIIVVVHGGGFVMGDKSERRDLCRELAAQGFVVFAINYRLAPEHRFPKAAIDTMRALEWVKAHSTFYGGDPARISLLGDSSGAHIAAIAVCALRSPQLRQAWGVTFPTTVTPHKMILYYGFYNLRDTTMQRRKYFKTYIKAYTGTTTFDHYPLLNAFSPVEFAGADLPPTLLIASEADPLCRQTLEYANTLAAAGVPTNLLLFNKAEYPEALHGFMADANTPAARQAMAAVSQFLRQE